MLPFTQTKTIQVEIYYLSTVYIAHGGHISFKSHTWSWQLFQAYYQDEMRVVG